MGIRAVTLLEHLESLGIPVDGDLDDSNHVLSLLVSYYTNITTNSSVATYVALESMFKFGWELSELVRLVSIRDLTNTEREEVRRLLGRGE
jgi:hypothetical protein